LAPFGQIYACGEKREAGKRGKLRSYEARKLGKTVPFGQINACGEKRKGSIR